MLRQGPGLRLAVVPILGRYVVFGDPAMTVAVVDRLVHHATIFEMNVESYRRRAALEPKRSPGRPPVSATIKANA